MTIHINEEEQQNQYKRKRNKSPNDLYSNKAQTYITSSIITNNNSESILEHSSNVSDSSNHIVRATSNDYSLI